MDLKNLTTTSQYAISSFYEHIYNFIPEEYRIPYKQNEAVDCQREFYDPELTVDNRLRYKATKIEYVARSTPWIAIMWNSEGMQPADNHFRSMDVRIKNEDGTFNSGKACFVKRQMNIGVVSNSLTALDEFQEVFWLNVRPDDCTITAPHPYIEDFNVNIMDGINFSSVTKLPRNEGTLCMTMGVTNIQYPIVGCVDNNTGIIRTIRTNIRNMNDTIITKFNI